MIYFIILLILAGLVLIGFLYPYYVKWEVKERSKPVYHRAREDTVPEIDMHPKFREDNFYKGNLSYKKPSIINQLSPSSTIFIHNISWNKTTSGYIHTVGTMYYTPIRVRAERVHETIIGLSSSNEYTTIAISSTSLSRFVNQTAEFHPPLVLSEGTTFSLNFDECYCK